MTTIKDNAFNESALHESAQHEEYQYINFIRKIIAEGHWEEGRNGKTKSIFGHAMRFSLQNGKIPLLTTKKTAWKTCLKELLWFIRGATDNKLLQAQGVHIWDGNAAPEFMASRGLSHYPAGILGPLYGYQWRHFNAKYNYLTGEPQGNEEQGNEEHGNEEQGNEEHGNEEHGNEEHGNETHGIDQLQQIIEALKDPKQRTSRRLVMTAWNPCQLAEMALPPCHILCQFNVHDGNKLSCALYQRSCDFPLGSPINIASYSFLTHLLAKHCGLEAYEFIYFGGNCHIYEDHIEPIKAILERKPFEFPSLSIATIKTNISDYEVADFIVTNYHCHEVIKMQMVA
jgi:thymidylate synthase